MSNIAYVTQGTTPSGTGTGTGTTSVNVPYPTSLEGDLLLLAVWIKPDTATAPDLSGSSFTKVTDGEAAGGGGTTGLDTGPTRLCWYYRVVGASPPAGSLTVTPGSSPNCVMGQMFLLRSLAGAGSSWDVDGANGIDTTTGTPFTATMNVDPGIDLGDMVLVAGGIPTDITTPAQFSDATLTATGLTSGDDTEISEPESTQGNDQGGVVVRWSPTAGPSSAAATVSMTAGGTTTNVRGPLCLARARESSPNPAAYFVGASATCPTGQGTNTTSGGTDDSVEYPAGASEGDLLVLVMTQKASDGASSDYNTPTDWTSLTNTVGGTGSYGTDTGQTRIHTFWREVPAGGLGPGTLTVVDTMAAGSNVGFMVLIRKDDPSATWDVAGATGDDTTTGTPLTATMGSNPGIDAEDVVIGIGNTPTDVNAATEKYTSPTLTATGLTAGDGVNIYTGNYPNTSHTQDHGGPASYWTPTAGPASAAPTVSWTATGTTTNVAGPIHVVRVRAVTAGITEDLNQSSETDAAQTFDKAKEKALGQSSETDTAQALAAAKTKDLNQATAETDTAQALVVQKSHEIQVSETDLAQPFTSEKTKALEQSSETDEAQAFVAAKTKEIGQAEETDTALGFTSAKTKALGIASETDEAPSFVAPQEVALETAEETDVALPMAAAKTKALGVASETDEAQTLAGAKTKAIGQTEETDETFAVASAKTRELGIASETDAVIPFQGEIREPLNQASETDLAQALASAKTKEIGAAGEDDSAQALASAKTKEIGQAEETDFALPMAAAKTRELGIASETDEAQALAGAKAKELGVAGETDTALGLNVQGDITEPLETASETDLAQTFASAKTKEIGQTEDVEVALPMTATKTKTLGQAIETGAPLPFVRVKEKALGQAEETDAPLPFLRLKSLTIGQAVEASETFSFDRMKEKTLGVAGELDEAPPFIIVSFVADVDSAAAAATGVISAARARAAAASGVDRDSLVASGVAPVATVSSTANPAEDEA